MSDLIQRCRTLTDGELLLQAKVLASGERKVGVALIATIAVIGEKKLYEPAYNSLYDYCRRELKLTEDAAYKRIRIARLLPEHPDLLERLESGDQNLSSLLQLAPHITSENKQVLLEQTKDKSKREVERFVAGIAPREDLIDSVRAAPGRDQPSDPSVVANAISSLPLFSEQPPLRPAPPSRDSLEYLSGDRVCFRFTGPEALRRKLDLLRDLLRRRYPEGRLEDLLDAAVEALLKDIDPARQQTSRQPAMTGTRSIPRWVRRAVCRRDGNRCAWIDPTTGCRCEATTFLEYDHIVPWAMGGRSDDPQNIRRLCRAHNQWRARNPGKG